MVSTIENKALFTEAILQQNLPMTDTSICIDRKIPIEMYNKDINVRLPYWSDVSGAKHAVHQNKLECLCLAVFWGSLLYAS